jgi:oligopeptide/dipeptide ABC transporter ATP-binding protein
MMSLRGAACAPKQSLSGLETRDCFEPRLLILDEPTAMLDVSGQVVILQLLETLKRRLGISLSATTSMSSACCATASWSCISARSSRAARSKRSSPTRRTPTPKALVAAIPSFDQRRIKRLRLSGEPRSPIDPDPDTCRFYGRGPKGRINCATLMPELRPFDTDGSVACHYPEVVIRAEAAAAA